MVWNAKNFTGRAAISNRKGKGSKRFGKRNGGGGGTAEFAILIYGERLKNGARLPIIWKKERINQSNWVELGFGGTQRKLNNWEADKTWKPNKQIGRKEVGRGCVGVCVGGWVGGLPARANLIFCGPPKTGTFVNGICLH